MQGLRSFTLSVPHDYTTHPLTLVLLSRQKLLLLQALKLGTWPQSATHRVQMIPTYSCPFFNTCPSNCLRTDQRYRRIAHFAQQLYGLRAHDFKHLSQQPKYSSIVFRASA